MRWLSLLAGPILWAVHFTAAYAIASLSIQFAGEVTHGARMALAVLAVLLIIGAIVLALPRRGSGNLDSFTSAIRSTGSVLAAIAIAWQSLPLLLQP